MSERQIILDTETTGLELAEGHRIIEIGCVELRNRRITGNDFHHYLNPARAIDAGALGVHGITVEFLANKPGFAAVAGSLEDYLRGAELIIHNAEFDLGFLNMEFKRAGFEQKVQDYCTVIDTLALARQLHPGQKNSLDALCRRYSVNNSQRDQHGALLDARLLSDVYLSMTGGQSALLLERNESRAQPGVARARRAAEDSGELVVVRASDAELALHRQRLQAISKKAAVVWNSDLPATGTR